MSFTLPVLVFLFPFPAFYLLSSLEQNILHTSIFATCRAQVATCPVWCRASSKSLRKNVVCEPPHMYHMAFLKSFSAEIGEILCFVRLPFCDILFRGVKYNQNCLFSFGVVSFIVCLFFIVFLLLEAATS